MAVLGVIELSHFWRDRDRPEDSVQMMRQFVERPVLTRIEMKPGVWYRYRGAQRIADAKLKELKLLIYLILGTALMIPLTLLLPVPPGSPGRNPMDILAICPVFLVGTGLLAWLFLKIRSYVFHRFCIVGDQLVVDTPSGSRFYPAPARRLWKGPTRQGGWLQATDSYGRGLKSYSIDPCYLEEAT